MQGRVLGFDTLSRTGVIRGQDEARYAFSADDWKGTGNPAAKDEVDFEPLANRATEIFVTRAAGAGLDLSALSEAIDTEAVRAMAAPFASRWAPSIAVLIVIACFWTLMFIGGPAGGQLPNYSASLFGTPGIVADGAAVVQRGMEFANQATQLGSNSASSAPSSSPLLGLAELLSYTLWLIPLGAAVIVFRAFRGMLTNGLVLLTGILALALPLAVFFAVSLAIDSTMKEVNDTIRAFGQMPYHAELESGGWIIIGAGVALICCAVGIIKGGPRDLMNRQHANAGAAR